MRRVSGKDTTPEKRVGSFIHRLGYRFQLHVRSPLAKCGTSPRSAKNIEVEPQMDADERRCAEAPPPTLNSQLSTGPKPPNGSPPGTGPLHLPGQRTLTPASRTARRRVQTQPSACVR